MAKKPAKKQVEEQVNDSFDIVADDREVTFNLHFNNQPAGKIVSTVCELHRLMLVSQHEAFSVRKDEDYVPYYAKNLSSKFNVHVSEPAAYRIACVVADLFVEQKKS
jgi:hypothetical protein